MDALMKRVIVGLRDRHWWQQVWASAVAGFVALLPLILSVNLYIDDIERAMDGSLGWVRLGRPLADVLMEWLNFGRPLVAVAPLHTLAAIAVLSLTGVMCARAYGERSLWWTALASLPLMAQPYALQAMSYGFDSLIMALALGAALLAALSAQRVRDWRGWGTALLLLVVSFNLYQPAANGFLVMTGFLCIASALNLLEQPWQRLTLSGRLLRGSVVYAGGYGLYRLCFALLFEHRLNRYASSAAEFKQLDLSLLQALSASALEPFQQLWDDFGRWPVVMPLLLFLLTYFVVLKLWSSWRVAGLVVAAAAVVSLLAPGGLLLLRESFVRHPRVLLYVGPLLTNLILQILAMTRRSSRQLWRLAVVPLIWLMVVVSYAYGHAFAAQAEFEQGQLSRIVAAASQLQSRDGAQPAQFLIVQGTMPRSPVLNNTVRKFPLIDRLIPPLLDGNQTFSFSQLRLHGLDLAKRRPEDLEGVVLESCVPSPDAICTSEFSLQRVAGDTLLLRRAALSEGRSST